MHQRAKSIASVTRSPLTCYYNPLRGRLVHYTHTPFLPTVSMHFTPIFAFAVLLAGQGMVHYWQVKKCPDHALPRAALALDINITSLGTIQANQFLAVQDSDLTTQVRHTEPPDC
jgi:hypothetical protein